MARERRSISRKEVMVAVKIDLDLKIMGAKLVQIDDQRRVLLESQCYMAQGTRDNEHKPSSVRRIDCLHRTWRRLWALHWMLDAPPSG